MHSALKTTLVSRKVFSPVAEGGGGDWPDETTTGTTGSLIAIPGTETSGTGWSWDGVDLFLNVNGDGATLTGYDVAGPVVIQGDNVTFTNCRVTSTEAMGIQVLNASGVTIEDCEIVGSGDVESLGQNGIWIDTSPNTTVRRCNIHGSENGIMLAGLSALIEDNYIHDLISEDLEGADPHTDGIQIFGGNIADGSIIQGNNVIVPTTWATSAIIIGSIANLQVDNNRFRGGFAVFRAYLDDTCSYTNNRIGDLSPEPGALLVTDNGGTGNPTWTGNVNDDTDEPIASI